MGQVGIEVVAAGGEQVLPSFDQLSAADSGYHTPYIGTIGVKGATLGQDPNGAWDDNNDASKGYKAYTTPRPS